MEHSGRRMTKFETVLYAWTALNTAIGVWALLTGEIKLWGAPPFAWVPLAVGLLAAAYLLWSMRRPTTAILVLGTFFWLFQSVSVQLEDELYKFRLGMSIDLGISNDSTYTIAINILAIVVAGLFCYAAIERSESDDQFNEERT
jgi:hypothetical protein